MSGTRAGAAPRTVTADLFEESERAAKALGSAEVDLGVVFRDIPLDAIEPDPAQPRRVFHEEKLQSLADSVRKYGVLQEPGVVPVPVEGADGTARYRLIWGERRWRASRLAGRVSIRCKVLPSDDGSAIEQLRTRERQWAENVEREGLSAIEEAIAIQDAADLERKMHPDVAVGDLVEKVGSARGLHGSVARNLVALLKAPRSLQSALMARAIGREVGFELARGWNRLLTENELRGSAKREIQYRNLVEAWAHARAIELDAQALTRYAAETFQDPKVVKTTCRKAEEIRRAVLERFDALVARAQKEGWTVARTRAELSERRRKVTRDGALDGRLQCFERTGRGQNSIVVHLDRLRDPAVGTDSIAKLLAELLGLVREIETAHPEVSATRRAEPAEKAPEPPPASGP